MFENKNELEAREEILSFVDEYCKKYHAKKEYHEGDRISYASRVYDSAEMKNLVNSALEFWLTAGHYTDEFEKKFYVAGVRHYLDCEGEKCTETLLVTRGDEVFWNKKKITNTIKTQFV